MINQKRDDVTTETFHLDSMACPRCGYQPDTRDPANYLGCPKCQAQLGIPVNYVVQSTPPSIAELQASRERPAGLGIWRWAPQLPVGAAQPVSLNEGNTPLISLPTFGSQFGATRLHIKNESANPTWSHKDRLCAAAVTAAKALGARAVVAASTGNHGASLAAYAARAGMPCVISTLNSVPQTMRVLMESYGAEVRTVEHSEERFEAIAAGVRNEGWYPCSNSSSPPVGSSPYGVDAYKTIAYELWAQTDGKQIDAVVVPTGYGDCLRGIARGFDDLYRAGAVEKLPRLIAAEIFGKVGRSMNTDPIQLGPWPIEESAAFSIGGGYTTYQAVDTIKSHGGEAVVVPESSILATQLELARSEGVYAEASSAVAVAAAAAAYRDSIVEKDDLVVIISTSSGLKDPAATAAAIAAMKRGS
ncbi:pyridoxal-phosphate dependent enzyme [Streptomyces sp. SRF1]|uniref:pyridoxal-phosphate dependent enzyme n=1 Tax=Streptomyces sp. SRF1 TaxID=1549642 RepID=UPI0025B20FFD|nr:pyridoxal-phosphate dependent enzyme [Streptomyces sp. SRF1]MDN3061053.1 pyridoxal-phosphate dependent enzyme [Streptomyces sp. SRF1]